jgi:hypothetical protein
VTTSAGFGAGRPATSSAATSNPVANPAIPVTAAEPQVGRPLIRAPPRHAQRRYEDYLALILPPVTDGAP